jgi:spermidine synthase
VKQPTQQFQPAVASILFAASGCAALIYEIVWLQLLQLAIGSSAVSLAVLLGTYMGGLCLDSLLFRRTIRRGRNPMRVYASLELGIGIFGCLVLWAIPLVDRSYAALAAHVTPGGVAGVVLRAIAAAVCLIPPTVLMGASLPAIARWVESDAEGVSWMGRLYAMNIAGAVVGCLAAGFYLLRVFDMPTATYAAVGINFIAAGAAWALGRAGSTTEGVSTPAAVAGSRAVYAAIALSGMCALGAEVVWTRLLSLMLGATTYTFSIVLAVFLASMGLGSAAATRFRQSAARTALGWSQLMAAGAVAWAAFSLADSLPWWPIDPLLSTNAWFNFQVDLMRCLWVVLPAAWLWGASFTLALKAAARPGEDPGTLAGTIYAANTVGAIAGALGFSLIFIPGSEHAARSKCSSGCRRWPESRRSRRAASYPRSGRRAGSPSGLRLSPPPRSSLLSWCAMPSRSPGSRWPMDGG